MKKTIRQPNNWNKLELGIYFPKRMPRNRRPFDENGGCAPTVVRYIQRLAPALGDIKDPPTADLVNNPTTFSFPLDYRPIHRYAVFHMSKRTIDPTHL